MSTTAQPVSTALVAPTMRVLVIEAVAMPHPTEQWTVDYAITPVLALESTIRRTFMTAVSAGPLRGSDPSAEITHDAIVADPVFGLVSVGALESLVENAAFEIIAAPWDASEDDARLAPARERLRQRAIDQARAAEDRAAEIRTAERRIAELRIAELRAAEAQAAEATATIVE